MNISQTENGVSCAIITIDIPKSDYIKELDNKLKDFSKKVHVDGFRPGQVPMNLIKSRYGKSLMQELIFDKVDNSLNEYIKEKNISPMGKIMPFGEYPNVSIFNPSDYAFKFEVGYEPEFDIQGLGATLPYYDVAVSQSDIDAQMKKVIGDLAPVTDLTEGEVQAEDTVEFEIYKVEDGAPVTDATIETCGVYAQGEAGINTFMIGKKIGEEFSLENEDLKVMDAKSFAEAHQINEVAANHSFKGTILSVKRKDETAEITPEKISTYFRNEEINSLEAATDFIKEELKRSVNGASEMMFRNDVFLHIVQNNDLPLPKEFLTRFIVAENNLSEEQAQSEVEKMSRSLNWNCILNKVSTENSLNVTYEEVVEFFRQRVLGMLGGYYYEQLVNQLVEKTMSDEKKVREASEEIVTGKVLANLATQMKRDTKYITAEEFEQVKIDSEKAANEAFANVD